MEGCRDSEYHRQRRVCSYSHRSNLPKMLLPAASRYFNVYYLKIRSNWRFVLSTYILNITILPKPIYSTNVYTATAIPFIYSFSGNSAALAPISTFMFLWAIHIFPGSIYIFPPAELADPSWEYIIRSQTHECGNWDWGLEIPFLGIFVSNFRHFVFAVYTKLQWFLNLRNCSMGGET